jgi:hypothetical protein
VAVGSKALVPDAGVFERSDPDSAAAGDVAGPVLDMTPPSLVGSVVHV